MVISTPAAFLVRVGQYFADLISSSPPPSTYDLAKGTENRSDSTNKSYHTRQWDDSVGDMLSSMMALADYTEKSMSIHRDFFTDRIAKLLGPYPTSDRNGVCWRSFMTDDHTPLEFSWSWSDQQEIPTVRYAIEPIGWLAGTASDPLNIQATAVCLGETLPLAPSLDLQWYRYFSKALIADRSDQKTQQSMSSNPPSQTFVGFDLEEDTVVVKYYLIPSLKSASQGKSNLETVEQAINDMPSYGSTFSTCLGALTSYIHSHNSEVRPQVEIFAIDCVEPAKSRLKIYVRCRDTTFNGMLEAMTLGGRLQPFSEKTVSSLAELWCACFGVEATAETSLKPRQQKDHRTGGLLYYFELKSGETLPTSKVYLPVRHYAHSDEQIARGLSSFLERRGKHLARGQTYYDGVKKLCKHRSLGQSRGFHTYITCAVKKEALSINAYYNPEVYKRYVY